MMKRLDWAGERSDAAISRGFRVLEAGGRYLEPLTPPPPPRAPEPYKVVPPSSSLGRAHRRSSFVIIAETRPATPRSTSPSPNSLLGTGRVSPFRGRGFKGPLPHAQSRPQSPENRRHERFDPRASLSQQSSPKRSLIPQPTRRRSVSLTNKSERKPYQPKFGRRAPASRNNSNKDSNSNSNTEIIVSSRHSLKAPDLSPIQGTPTKPSAESHSARLKGGNSLNAKGSSSPLKSRKLLAVPKNVVIVPNGKQNSRERSPAKIKRFVEEQPKNSESDSPTKIPIRRGSIINNNKHATIRGKPSKERGIHSKNNDRAKDYDGKTTTSVNENRGLRRIGSRTEDRNEPSRFIDMSTPPAPPDSSRKPREDDLGLIDLLKQSSGATGTSSVVNTTTTTAVQPLQIEAAVIFLENDRSKIIETTKAESSTAPVISPDVSPVAKEAMSSLPPKTVKTSNIEQPRASNKLTEHRDNPVVVPATLNNGMKNPVRGITEEMENSSSKKKESTSGQNIRDKTIGSKESAVVLSTGSSKKNLPARNGGQEKSRSEILRVPSAKSGSRGGGNYNNNNSNNNHNNNKNSNNNNNNNNTNNDNALLNNSSKSEPSDPVKQEAKSLPENVDASQLVDSSHPVASGHKKSERKGSTGSTKNIVVPDPEPKKMTLTGNVAGANKPAGKIEPASTIIEDKKFSTTTTHGGSEASLKSLNGLSTGSITSLKSTDTGVSVNTVKGVSSAMEKKGIHTMKRTEEIETLSANVMHLERNGEPTVIDIADDPREVQDQTRLGRLNKSLSRLRDRLSSMKWCRRNEKGHPWRRSQVISQPQRPEPPTSTGAIVNGAGSKQGASKIWTNVKNACMCMRLSQCKCWKRAARVTPAERMPCCPPERRCGALFQRLFARYKCYSCCCDKSDDNRTKSIRAKHSLTSVALPPLSEEQRAKIPEVLVEHNSVMRGAIPCLPVPLAWFCLVWNILLPGSGTVWSGLFNLCVGQPRFSISTSPRARFGALIINLIVGVGQFFTVLFCLVGWGWSIWWGVMMIRLARKYKRFRASEAASGDLEARGSLPAAAAGSQPLRGMVGAR